jgi:carboxymethylenebutenolidase
VESKIMMRTSLVLMLTCAASMLALDSGDVLLRAGRASAQAQFTRPNNDRVPPGTEQSEAELAASRLKAEWIMVPFPGHAPIKTFVVHPAGARKAAAVILVHGQYGLSIWARGVTNQVAEDGYIALAPDMLSGLGPGGGATPEVGSDSAAEKLLFALTLQESMDRLNAVYAYAKTLPSWNGKVGMLGFTWGGTRAFEAAGLLPRIDATVVYHAPAPQDDAVYRRITGPVLGLYAGNDPRANPTIEPTQKRMRDLGKQYEFEIFPGISQGWIRSQLEATGANYRATEKAWARTLAFLGQHLQ